MPPEMHVAFVTCGPQILRYKELDLFGSMMDQSIDGTTINGDTTTRTEHLSPVHMDGLIVQRLHVTNTSVDEHGQAKTWSSETWYSPELRELIRLIDINDDNNNEGLADINRKNPDPKLFYPPDTYGIDLQPTK